MSELKGFQGTELTAKASLLAYTELTDLHRTLSKYEV